MNVHRRAAVDSTFGLSTPATDSTKQTASTKEGDVNHNFLLLDWEKSC